MLTLTKTDTPVAAYLVSERVMGTNQQESMCTSVRRQAHLSHQRSESTLRSTMACCLQRERSDEITCDYPHEKFCPIFSRKERITMFIAGCQNCGKSYYISQFIRLYKTLRPERDQSTL